LDPFQNESSLKSYIHRVNEKFELPTSSTGREDFDFIQKVKALNFRVFVSFYFRALLTGKSYLLLVQNPFQLVEKFPKSFLHVQNYFANLQLEAVAEPSSRTIVLHIRRGSNGADLLPGEASPRMLDNSYYLSLIHEIKTKYCKINESLKLVVITDAPKENFRYIPITEQLPLWANEPRFKEGGIEMISETFSELDLDFLDKFTVVHGGDPIAAIEQMRDADFLVMSRSSFSFVGAVLNSRGKVFYPPNFWHRPMPNWTQLK
jgi:hypothetical protein